MSENYKPSEREENERLVRGGHMKSDEWAYWVKFIEELPEEKKTVALINILGYELACDDASWLRFYKGGPKGYDVRTDSTGESIFEEVW